MKIGIVKGTDDSEVVWNAFRLGKVALNENHSVKDFSINNGVEGERIKDEGFNVTKQLQSFVESKGAFSACGTCLKAEQKEGSAVCPISTLKDLLKLIEGSDKPLIFG